MRFAPKPDTDRRTRRRPVVLAAWLLVIASFAATAIAMQTDGPSGWARVRGTEADTWTLDPTVCVVPIADSDSPAYRTVFVEEGGRWMWIQPGGVTVGLVDHTERTRRVAMASRERCTRFVDDLEQSRSPWSCGEELAALSGEVELRCRPRSGGLIEADLTLDRCEPDSTVRPIDTLETVGEGLGVPGSQRPHRQ